MSCVSCSVFAAERRSESCCCGRYRFVNSLRPTRTLFLQQIFAKALQMPVFQPARGESENETECTYHALDYHDRFGKAHGILNNTQVKTI